MGHGGIRAGRDPRSKSSALAEHEMYNDCTLVAVHSNLSVFFSCFGCMAACKTYDTHGHF